MVVVSVEREGLYADIGVDAGLVRSSEGPHPSPLCAMVVSLPHVLVCALDGVD